MLAILLTALTPAWLLGPPIQRPTEPAQLTWEVPAECPSAEEFIERVHAFAPDVLTGDPNRARVAASIHAVEVGYQVEVSLSDSEGDVHRVLVGADCEEVSNAVALLVAVILDPVRSAREVQALQTAEPPLPPPSELPESPILADEPAPVLGPEPARALPRAPERPRVRAALRVAGGGGYGPTNTGFGDLGAAVAVFGARWRAELGGAWTPARELRNSDGIGGRFDGWRVAARGCFVPKLGVRDRLELPLCPGFELGQVRGRGLDDLPVALTASFPWIALALGQGLWFAPLERLAMGVDVQLAVPLRGGRFLVETVEVQRIAPVTVRGLVGIELRLP